MDILFKRCSTCKEQVDTSLFGRNKRMPDGLNSTCKLCVRQHEAKRKDKTRAYKQMYYQVNSELIIQRASEWQRANPQKAAANVQRSQQKNGYKQLRTPDQNRTRYHNRRARKMENGGTFTKSEWVDLKQKYGYKCLCCNRQEPEIALTPDHVIPLSRGGDNFISNIQPLCMDCNLRKHTKTTDYR